MHVQYTVALNQGCSPLPCSCDYLSQAVRQSCRVLGTRQTSATPAIYWQAFASLIPPRAYTCFAAPARRVAQARNGEWRGRRMEGREKENKPVIRKTVLPSGLSVSVVHPRSGAVTTHCIALHSRLWIHTHQSIMSCLPPSRLILRSLAPWILALCVPGRMTESCTVTT